MNKNILLTTVATALLASSSFAGEHIVISDKQPRPPEIMYGVGPYLALQAGINAYQDFGGTRRFTLGGDDIAIEPTEQIGFVGGLKLGYVFGTGSIRPTIEADVFYNGVRADVDLRVNGDNRGFNADGDLRSVAFLGNFLLRFGTGQFQPYIGAGAGGYWAEVDDIDITIGGNNFHGDGGDNSGFAWQLIGGADYYCNEHLSIFGEYKYLNYEDTGLVDDRVSQHIVVLGVRWHF
jgi:opacity protein-like surface antigen